MLLWKQILLWCFGYDCAARKTISFFGSICIAEYRQDKKYTSFSFADNNDTNVRHTCEWQTRSFFQSFVHFIVRYRSQLFLSKFYISYMCLDMWWWCNAAAHTIRNWYIIKKDADVLSGWMWIWVYVYFMCTWMQGNYYCLLCKDTWREPHVCFYSSFNVN